MWFFDFAIVKLPLLILSVLTRLYSLMVKTSHYQRMEILRMQVQNQWEASSMAVEPLLQGSLRHINKTYQYTSFGEW